MEAEKNCTEKQQEQEQGLEEGGEGEGEVLRRRISSHPLYGLLVETHLNCLKVGSIGEMGRGYPATDLKLQDNKFSYLSKHSLPELDLFMETYCFSLSMLKEAMEESQLKSMAFIKSMHSQLRELTVTNAAATEPATSSSSSSDTNGSH